MNFRGTDPELSGVLRSLKTSVAFAEFVKFLDKKYHEAAQIAVMTHGSSAISMQYRAGEANAIRELHKALYEILSQREVANA